MKSEQQVDTQSPEQQLAELNERADRQRQRITDTRAERAAENRERALAGVDELRAEARRELDRRLCRHGIDHLASGSKPAASLPRLDGIADLHVLGHDDVFAARWRSLVEELPDSVLSDEDGSQVHALRRIEGEIRALEHEIREGRPDG